MGGPAAPKSWRAKADELVPGWVHRIYMKYGLLHFSLLLTLLFVVGRLIYIRHMSLATAVIIIGIVSALSIVVNQDEIKFRAQRRAAMTEVVSLAASFVDCFDEQGNDINPRNTNIAFAHLQKACMRLHLLARRQQTLDSLDALIKTLSDIRKAATGNRKSRFVWFRKPNPPCDHYFSTYDDALQFFIMRARQELGLTKGNPVFH